MTSTDIISTAQIPALVGIEGLVKGSIFPIEDGNEIIVGRSRSCDISLRKLDSYKSMEPADREKDHDFNTVSRSHIRIQVIKDNLIRCEDISTNGTYCNDELVTEPIDIDLTSDQETIIRLGARESFKLVLIDPCDASGSKSAPAADNGEDGNGIFEDGSQTSPPKS